jgi:hypothetical protein
VVKIVCAWCADEGRPAIIGEKEPLDDPGETTGVCKWHKARLSLNQALLGTILALHLCPGVAYAAPSAVGA